jgi:hypothetical protein
MPVEAMGKINLRKTSYANEKMRPVIELSGVQLGAGAKFRVSTVHKTSEADKGDGVIDADGDQFFYLIIDCPFKSSAQGLFVRTSDVNQITEEEYAQKSTQIDPQALPNQKVKATPRDSSTSIFLFEETSGGSIERSNLGTLAKGMEFIIVPKTTMDPNGKEFYRILKYPANPKYEGLYINAKDVTPVLEASSEV